jgi:hypothetical protein
MRYCISFFLFFQACDGIKPDGLLKPQNFLPSLARLFSQDAMILNAAQFAMK